MIVQTLSTLIKRFSSGSLQVTSNGLPFWSGSKRCPHPLTFDPNNVSSVWLNSSCSCGADIHGVDANDRKRPQCLAIASHIPTLSGLIVDHPHSDHMMILIYAANA